MKKYTSPNSPHTGSLKERESTFKDDIWNGESEAVPVVDPFDTGLPKLSDVLDEAMTKEFQVLPPMTLVSMPEPNDPVVLGHKLLMALPATPQAPIIFVGKDFEHVLLAVKRNFVEYGGQLQWLNPQQFTWRGAMVVKG